MVVQRGANLLDKNTNFGTFDYVPVENTPGVNSEVLAPGRWVRVDVDIFDLEQVVFSATTLDRVCVLRMGRKDAGEWVGPCM